jgi:SAM-dependent methyltransferase
MMASRFKPWVRRVLHPVLRAWPDEGRRIVQGPVLAGMLAEVAQAGPSRRVFNAGAGEGGYTALLLALPGLDCLIESDLGPRTRLSVQDPRVRQVVASLTAIPFADASMDLVFCTEVLEHIRDDERALEEIRRTVAPGGWVLITVPTPPAVPDHAHVREGYRQSELETLLRARGFEIRQVRFCMHYFFRLVLRIWPRLPWNPRVMVRGLSQLDRVVRLGPPMDLLILARRPR